VNLPEDLKYTAEHEWVRATEGHTLRVGITDYAQSALGDIVYVSLPGVGTAVTAGQPMGEVESTKSVSDVFAPIAGTVLAATTPWSRSPSAQLRPVRGGLDRRYRGRRHRRGQPLLDADAYRELVEDS
jgi:glycine cleavage system H protein